MKYKSAVHSYFRRLYFRGPRGFLDKIVLLLLNLLVPFYSVIRFCDQRIKFLRRRSLSVPVISVGNLSIGGTGKTAFVLWLLERVKENGFCPAVLKRGEGPEEGILNGQLVDASRFGDEAALINNHFPAVPVGVGANRYRRGREIEKSYSDVDVFVLDDGFQHRRLERQLDIVLFASTEEILAAQLPAGPLREPVFALRRADFLSLKTNEKKMPGDWEEFCTSYVDTAPMNHYYQFEGIWRGKKEVTGQYLSKPVILLTTLARPRRLVDFVSRQKIKVEDCISLPDHARIEPSLLAEINLDKLVVTEKELGKLPERFSEKVGCLRSKLVVKSSGQLLKTINNLMEEN